MISRTLLKTQRVKLFGEARAAFLQYDQKQAAPNVELLCQHVKVFREDTEAGDPCVIFGVKLEDQALLQFDQVRAKISVSMGFQHEQGFMQFIGDSTRYSKSGTAAGRDLIGKVLNDHDSIILYGYTGSSTNKLSVEQRDVNQLVSDWVDECADATRSDRVLANIVDEHTVTAIETWGCTISEKVRYFYLVYTDTPTPTAKFGDDIPSSDGLTNVKAYSLDGGIQSLRQIMYMLRRHVPIYGLGNLRDLSDSTNARVFDPESKLPYLSAVDFIGHMKLSLSDDKSEVTEAVVREIANVYLATHALYNTNKSDAGTKEVLWNDAMRDLIDGGCRSLGLFTYETAAKVSDRVSAKALLTRYQQDVRHSPDSVRVVSSSPSSKRGPY